MEAHNLIGKIQRNFNITLPKQLRTLYHLHMGDFVKFLVVKEGILLKPKKLIDSSQSYFWTKEWQKDEIEADEDIAKGKVSKTKNAKELISKLKK